MPGRQRVRRGVADAAALPRGAAQLGVGGVGQRQRARRAARARPRARGPGGVDHRGRPGPRRRRPAGRGHRLDPRAAGRADGRPRSLEVGARRLAGRMAAVLQGSLLVRFSPPEVADVFCASRLGTSYDGTFGALAGGDLRGIVERTTPSCDAITCRARVRSVNAERVSPIRRRTSASPASESGRSPWRTWASLAAKHGGLGSRLVGDFTRATSSRATAGHRQAVYAFAGRSWTPWEDRLGQRAGRRIFGENRLTTDRHRRGRGPGRRPMGRATRWCSRSPGRASPCATFAHRMGERGWLRTFAEVGLHWCRTWRSWRAARCAPGDRIRGVAMAAHDVGLPTDVPQRPWATWARPQMVLRRGPAVVAADDADWLRRPAGPVRGSTSGSPAIWFADRPAPRL